ncbi:talin rod domain-containing protein 1-like [Lycorma delicatula]|uniref:talin rod domain-containing protein 1-like n=1 Tax=Lycorma delicatula TaxID=130591 RepID=UPI003F50F97E
MAHERGLLYSEDERMLNLICTLCENRMQNVADLLLLNSDPRPVRVTGLGESLLQSRETITSRIRGLTILLRDLSGTLTGVDVLTTEKCKELGIIVQEICSLVVSLTECSAHCGYYLSVLSDNCSPEVPGIIDRYQITRAANEIEFKAGLLKTYSLDNVTSLQLTDVCICVDENTDLLHICCMKASEEATIDSIRDQFLFSSDSILATKILFQASIKALKDRPSNAQYKACQVFGESLSTCCNAMVVFATQDSTLTGVEASLTVAARDKLNSLLSACMAIVSPCVLVCCLLRQVISSVTTATKALSRLEQCQSAVTRAAQQLQSALSIHD